MRNPIQIHLQRFFLTALFALMGGVLNSFSQCPTITAPIQSFCDIDAPLISDLSAIDNGNGIRWYATATSTTPLSNGLGLIDGEDYYADDNSGTCGARQRVDVIIYGPPMALSFQGVCVDHANDAIIADLIATGNDIQWYTNSNGGTPLPTSTVLMDNTIYYVDQSNPDTGCRTSRLPVFVNVGVVPVPVGDAIQEFCTDSQSPTVADLQASGNNYWYLTISSASPLDPSTPLIDGQSYFATTVDPPCESVERLEVLVIFTSPPQPGTNGAISLCETELATVGSVNLFDALGGTPDTTGTWTGPLPTSNGNLGTVDVTVLTVAGSPYVFTYTVSSAACGSSTATVSISVVPPPLAGQDGSLLLCEDDAPVDLFDSLGGTPDPGGSWSPALASGTGIFDPAVDAPGTYTYTVSGTGPCGNASASVTVSVEPLPEPGNNGAISLCETELATVGSVNLFDALGGTPDTTGTWTGPLPTSNGNLGTVDVTVLTVAGSPYVFTYTVSSAACGSSTATVSISVVPPPLAGQDGSLLLCEDDAPVDLFDSLGGTPDPGGSWSPALASGTGIFDPAVDAPGTYTYTVSGTGPCGDASASVTVSVEPLPEPGNNGAISLCETELATVGSVNLFDALGGTPDTTGTWTGPLPTSNGNLGTVDVTTLTVAGSPYVFTYTVSSAVCGDSTATVSISVVPPPLAGQDGSLLLCEDDAPVDLFDSLGGTPDPGGSWSPALASGTGIFDPAVDAPGAYTYTVSGTGPCGDASASVTVSVEPLPEPGSNGAISLCETELATVGSVNLFDALGGTPDATGTWTGPLPTSNGNLGTVDVTVLTVAGSPYVFTYTVSSAACGSSTATVSISVVPPPLAGQDGSLLLCEDDAPVDLFDSLGGTPDPGGSWSPALASGTGIFDPAVDAPGAYTYTVSGTGPCGDASASVTVSVEPLPEPGSNGSLAICADDTAIYDLFDSLGGTPDPGGTWSPALASGTGIFDPAVDAPGTYTYAVGNASACGIYSATVTVAFNPVADAGSDGAISLCDNGTPVDLFDSLGGNPISGGIWSPALASGTGLFDPTVDAAGTYTYTLSGPSFCGTDTSTVAVTLTPQPDVTGLTLNIPSICLGQPALVSLSGGTQLADGSYSITYTLSGANTSETTLVLIIGNGAADFNIPASLLTNPGTTTFTLSGLTNNTTTCNGNLDGLAPVSFEVLQDPTPQLVTGGEQFCSEDAPTIADLSANITGTVPVIWYDAAENGNPYPETTLLVDGNTYYASGDVPDGCDNGIRLAVTVSIASCVPLELIIPDGFSPNDDGINDDFHIKNLDELYPNFYLQIYNRYGNVLYQGDINTPRWDGTSDAGREFGNGNLPVGVYFYILELRDQTNRTIQGRVYLSR